MPFVDNIFVEALQIVFVAEIHRVLVFIDFCPNITLGAYLEQFVVFQRIAFGIIPADGINGRTVAARLYLIN